MKIEFTGLAVHESSGWIALCPEYDIAAPGDSVATALSNLANAVRQAVELAQEHRLAVGRSVPEEKVELFLRGHLKGDLAAIRRRFYIETDDIVVYIDSTELI